jgi:DedD protein
MSREAELYKDKIEVSLDGRQIFYLFFGGAVIVGLVFVLGVMVGRRVEARGHVDRARVAATVDPLAALDRLEAGSGLSFQGALRGGEAPASDVEKQIALMQKADLDAQSARPKKGDKAKTEPKPEAKPDAKAETKPDAKAETKPDAKAETKPDAKTEAKPEPKIQAKSETKTEAKTDAKTEAKTEPKTDAKTEAKKLESKSELAQGDKKVDAKDDAAAKEDKKRYTLQLSAFQDKHEAQAYLDSVKSAGYQAYVTEGAVDGKQYYRVRVGTYRSMDAANEAKAEFEKSLKKSAIVTRL